MSVKSDAAKQQKNRSFMQAAAKLNGRIHRSRTKRYFAALAPMTASENRVLSKTVVITGDRNEGSWHIMGRGEGPEGTLSCEDVAGMANVVLPRTKRLLASKPDED